ncbi:MAG: S4 domain-containing protein [Steroidobacteraceae bacterium]
MTNRQRIQKVLAAGGFGSRREVEAWVAEGRIKVNSRPARPGQMIGPGDLVTLDGRRLRLQWPDVGASQGLAYHRPAGEPVRRSAGSERAESSALERLATPGAGRWIPLLPMGPLDSGLELFLSDGELAAALMAVKDKLRAGYSLRIRGQLDESAFPDVQRAIGEVAGRDDVTEDLEIVSGDGANKWLNLATQGVSPRELREALVGFDVEINRLIRTRLGPVEMDRSMARGVSRPLSRAELGALKDLAGHVPRARPADRRRATGSRRTRR